MDNNNITAARKIAETGASGVPIRAMIFSGVIFALSLMVYGGLEFGYKTFLNASIKSLDDQIASLDRSAPAEESEQNFIRFYSLATNIGKLLRGHVASSPVFSFLEERTLPDVVIETMRFTVPDGGILISGSASAYDRLSSQLAIYENSPEVNRAGLISSRYMDNAIRFESNLSFDKELFSAAGLIERTAELEPVPEESPPSQQQ
ncbi:MAG: hypothetical protein PHP35_00570 [Candidatus Colwellbacteria bacterium]|nr:hypothetical protein [Candidatus Colwellbacteria bacterium]